MNDQIDAVGVWNLDKYFDVQDRWLDLEADAERERMAARRAAGNRDKAERFGETLLRMEIVSHETGLGGRFLLDFGRLGGSQLPMTRLKVGSPVVITDDEDDDDRGVTGVISRRKSHVIQVATEKWPEASRFRIDLCPDETTRRRQQAAMARMRTASGRTARLRDMVRGDEPIRDPRDDDAKIRFRSDLNPPQRDAVRYALASPDVAIIHGPPGTGKTTTVAEFIHQAVERGEKVLSCAPSNAGVDNLVEKVSRLVPDVVRLGHPARVHEDLRRYTLDYRVENDPTASVVREMRREVDQLMRQAGRDAHGRDARRRRGELYAEAGRLRGQIRGLERSIITSALDNADVICTTTTIDDDLIGNRQFDTAVVDEAGQATLPGIWQAVGRGNRLVLAGDHYQLPPTVLSDVARRGGLERSLMTRLVESHGDDVYRRLTVQYRMHEDIMRFSSDEFYDGELIADASVRRHQLDDAPEIESTERTTRVVEYFDTAGAGFDERIEKDGLSKYNPGEAKVVTQMVAELTDAGVSPKDIAIIAPYGAQVRLLRNRIDLRGIEIDTVDGFQGREKDAVILTMVRSNDSGEIGFLRETRRTNVAMTRARKKLIVVGDSATLGRDPFYARMLEYFESIDAYRTVWELDVV